MNSFFYTVYVIVMLLRRREAEERGEMKARGARWEVKRKRGLFPLPIVHCALNIFFIIIIAIFIWIPSGSLHEGER